MNRQNNPELRFQEFEGEIKQMRFGKVVQSNIYGPRFNANDYSDVGNVKTIRGTDLGSDGEIKYDQVPLALLDEKMVNTHKLLDGDIVMITTAECGATGVYRKQEVDFLSSAYGVRLRLNEQGYPYYFKYFFQTHQAKKEINSYIRKSTIANLPGSDILRIKVFLPTLPEQQKIASFLSAVDEKIQQLSRKKELLEQYKKGVMQQLFSGKLRFKDENGNDYGDWEEKKLGDVCEMTSSKRVYLNDYVKEGIPFYRGKEISELRLNQLPSDLLYISKERYEDFKSKYGVPLKNDILITAVGTLGNILRIRNDDAFYFKDGNLIWLRNISESAQFLEITLQWETKELIKTSIGSTQKALTMVELRKLSFNFPSKEEQQKIATFLSSIDIKIESTNQQITQTQSFKKGLLQQMFV
jgi:restriction endonuclease S subunit